MVEHGILHFIVAAGDMGVLKKMYPAIEAWAKAQGCTKGSMVGRRGWGRSPLTRDYGWKETHIVMTKDL